MKLFLKYATSRTCLLRAVKVALIVGTILNLLNHYDVLFATVVKPKEIYQMVFTYFVPFSVSTYSSAMQGRQLELAKQSPK